MAADGKELGRVTELGDTCFRIAAKRKRDYWLAHDAVEGRDAGIAVLFLDSHRLSEAVPDLSAHSGEHSHVDQKPKSGQSLGKPLVMLLGLGFYVMRDSDRRTKVTEMAKNVVDQAKARFGGKQDTDFSAPSESSAYFEAGPREPTVPPSPRSEVSPRQSPTPVDTKAREAGIVNEVALAFPQHDLQVSPVAVHTTQGGERDTLRFTLDGAASSDLAMERLRLSREADSTLATEVIEDLRQQLPPPVKE